MTITLTPARPRLTSLIVAASLGLGAMGTAQAATYYVRTDGGDATQCTGRGDAAYPGSGSAQNCAWKNPNIALPPSGSLRIAGGDTLLIGSGTYQIGSGGQMQPIPSGTSTTPTRIMGKSGATAPKLAGINGIHRVINMDGSSNVVLGNLEITDQSDCVYGHSNSSAACTSSMPWARVGLYARASRNVLLQDINIHGMAARGIQAGALADWTMERIKINTNGLAGWDGNVGTDGSNSGKMIMRDIEIAWNGCGERVSTGAPWACWAQQTGGYGDGFGTTSTGGQWLIEDAFIHHNTSDGLDLRYMDGADSTSVTMRRVHAVANAGNQVKVRGNSLIENSVLVGNCTYFKGKYYMVDGDHCRAYGSTVLLVLTGNDTAVLRHNTLAGEGDVQVGYTDGDSSDRIQIQNNTFVGFPYFNDTSVNTIFSGGKAPAVKSFTGNLAWNVRSCPSGNTCGVDPKLTSMVLSTFDAEPLSGSPVIDKAPMISAVTTDFLMGTRPTGAANDIGAYEYGAGATAPTDPSEPTPTCTRTAPTLSLAGTTASVAAGTTVSYNLTVRNNDSSGCANTSFNLARTVPAGWSGTLSAGSVNLAPGASASPTLAVTSASGTAAGTYNIGVGASSAVGSTHTGSASAPYSVKSVDSVESPALSGSVATSKTAYVAGETVYMSARVLNNGLPVSGASVRFAALKPNGVNTVKMSGTTGSDGYARVSFSSGTGSSSIGTYQLSATATSGTQSTTATSTFSVQKTAIAQLTSTVGTSKTTYIAGETVYLSARVLNNGLPVSGASVAFEALKPNDINTVKLSGTTDGNGYARASFVSGTGPSSIGSYQLTAAATSGSLTAMGSSTFSVEEPVTVALTQTVATNKTSYTAGETVYMKAQVLMNGLPVSGALVQFVALKPNGVNTIELSGTTDSKGLAQAYFKSGKGSSSIGVYQLSAVTTHGSLTATTKSSFTVSK